MLGSDGGVREEVGSVSLDETLSILNRGFNLEQER